MKHIQKDIRNEPRELKMLRSASVGNFDSLDKTSLKKAILTEQGFICCYCMSRIDSDSMSVEHYVAQHRHETSPFDSDCHQSMALNYSNLLGSCRYASNNPRDCSGIRGDWPLTVDPRNPNVERLVRCHNSGRLYSEDSRIDNELNMILQLNPQPNPSGMIKPSDPAISLISNRKAAIDEARRRMINNFGREGNWSKNDLESEKRYWLTKVDGKFRPYGMAAVHYLQSKLKYAQ